MRPTDAQLDALGMAVHNPRGAWIESGTAHHATEKKLIDRGWMLVWPKGSRLLQLTALGLDVYNHYRR